MRVTGLYKLLFKAAFNEDKDDSIKCFCLLNYKEISKTYFCLPSLKLLFDIYCSSMALQ